MSDCIPAIQKVEFDRTMEELKKASALSFSFDGTTEVAELLAVVVRFLSGNMRISATFGQFVRDGIGITASAAFFATLFSTS